MSSCWKSVPMDLSWSVLPSYSTGRRMRSPRTGRLRTTFWVSEVLQIFKPEVLNADAAEPTWPEKAGNLAVVPQQDFVTPATAHSWTVDYPAGMLKSTAGELQTSHTVQGRLSNSRSRCAFASRLLSCTRLTSSRSPGTAGGPTLKSLAIAPTSLFKRVHHRRASPRITTPL